MYHDDLEVILTGYGPRTCECFLNVYICPVGREIIQKGIVFPVE